MKRELTAKLAMLAAVCALGALCDRAAALTGAEAMPPESFRFVAYVGDDYGYCTGAIIAPTWVLTAAHCVVHGDGSTIKPEEIGDLSRGWPDDDWEKVPVKRVIAHPHYYWQGDGFRNDVALLELARPFSSEPAPVQVLGLEDEARYAANGATAVMIGYGENEHGQRDRDGLFRVVEAPLYHLDACRVEHLFVDPRTEIVHDRTICAGDRDRGIRGGDSGGPLLVRTEGGYGLVGVASISGHDRSGHPVVAVYTRVALVKDWIDGCVLGTGECLEGLPLPELKRYGADEALVSETLEPRSTAIVFVNDTERAVSYHWIAFDGALRQYGAVDPGESYTQHTYPGHVWAIKDDGGRTVALFVAERETARAVVCPGCPFDTLTGETEDAPDDSSDSFSAMTRADFDELCSYVEAGDHAQIDRMVQAGADVNKRFYGYAYRVPVHCAQDPETLAYLVEEHGADPDGTMRDGEHLDTPVCMARTLDMAKEFVRLGAILRGRGDESQSLVECASYYGNAEMVEWWRTLENTPAVAAEGDTTAGWEKLNFHNEFDYHTYMDLNAQTTPGTWGGCDETTLNKPAHWCGSWAVYRTHDGTVVQVAVWGSESYPTYTGAGWRVLRGSAWDAWNYGTGPFGLDVGSVAPRQMDIEAVPAGPVTIVQAAQLNVPMPRGDSPWIGSISESEWLSTWMLMVHDEVAGTQTVVQCDNGCRAWQRGSGLAVVAAVDPELPALHDDGAAVPTQPVALLPGLSREKIAQVLDEALSATMWNMHGEEVPDWVARLRAVELAGLALSPDGGAVTVDAAATDNLRWVSAAAGDIPPSAIPGGAEANGQVLYICRANFEGGIHPGKISHELGACIVPWGMREHYVDQYEVLTGGSRGEDVR